MSTPATSFADQVGELRGPDTIAQAVIARLKQWGPAYCDFVGVTPWKGVIRLQDVLDYPENQLPALVLLVPNTNGEPLKTHDGYYSAVYNVVVSAIALAKTEGDTRRIVEQLGVAVRGCLIQRRKLADKVTTEAWAGELTDNLVVSEQRRLLLCTNSFTVRLDDVVSWQLGPDTGIDPGDVTPWPVATDVELTITKVS